MFEDWCDRLGVLSGKGLSRPELCDALTALARLQSATEACEARLASAVEQLGDNGVPASTVLRSVGRRSQRDADRRARRAQTLEELPAAAEALAEGRITGEHVYAW